MRFAKNVFIFAFVGLTLSLIIFGVSGAAPTFFGWLTAPFWILPAIANLGTHDVNMPLFMLSGTFCYGAIAFLIYRWRSRHIR